MREGAKVLFILNVSQTNLRAEASLGFVLDGNPGNPGDPKWEPTFSALVLRNKIKLQYLDVLEYWLSVRPHLDATHTTANTHQHEAHWAKNKLIARRQTGAGLREYDPVEPGLA